MYIPSQNYMTPEFFPLGMGTSQSSSFCQVSPQKWPILYKKNRIIISLSISADICHDGPWAPRLTLATFYIQIHAVRRYGGRVMYFSVYSPIIRLVITLSFSLMEFWSTPWDCSFLLVDGNTSCSYSGWYWSRTSQYRLLRGK